MTKGNGDDDVLDATSLRAVMIATKLNDVLDKEQVAEIEGAIGYAALTSRHHQLAGIARAALVGITPSKVARRFPRQLP